MYRLPLRESILGEIDEMVMLVLTILKGKMKRQSSLIQEDWPFQVEVVTINHWKLLTLLLGTLLILWNEEKEKEYKKFFF